MIFEVKMPKMGESLTEGTLIKWHKKLGDFVKKDEPLFDIATDKVDTEIPSPCEGYLLEILVEEGTTVEIDTVVAKISSENKQVSDNKDVSQSNLISKDAANNLAEQENKIISSSIVTDIKNERNQKRFLSPLVKSIIKAENISEREISNIKGSGIDGRITKDDILKYLETRKTQNSTNITKSYDVENKPVTNNNLELVYEMDKMRSKISDNMVLSRDNAVHVSEVAEADVTEIVNYLKKNKKMFEQNYGTKVTFTAIVLYVVSKALRKFPLLNASLDGKKIIEKKYINIGVAIALEPNGLVVPNIKNVDELNLIGIAKKLEELKYKAYNKKLIADDFQNGTFTITNYGVFDTLFGTPIINYPEVAILGIGAINKKVVVKTINDTDTIQIRSMIYLSLSHDHRLIDGMMGGKFLKYIKDELENYKFQI